MKPEDKKENEVLQDAVELDAEALDDVSGGAAALQSARVVKSVKRPTMKSQRIED